MVKKSNFVEGEDNSVVRSNHLPFETIVISHKGEKVNASPFKRINAESNATTFSQIKKSMEQNNFFNNSLHFIGQQLDHIEKKNHVSTLTFKPEKPLINLLEIRQV